MLKVKQCKKICHANITQIWSGYINIKVDFRTKTTTRDKEDHFLMITRGQFIRRI